MDEISTEEVKALSEALYKTNIILEKRHVPQWLTTWLSTIIAVLTLATTSFSIWNHISLQKVQDKQADFSEKQNEFAGGMNVLHETLSLLDTKDQAILQAKILMQLGLLSNLLAGSDSPIASTTIRGFYNQLGASLAEQLTDKTKKQEMLSFFEVNPSEDHGSASAPGPRKVSGVAISQSGEAQAPAKAGVGLDVDVFWCVRNAEYPAINGNEELAVKLFGSIVSQHTAAAVGKIRLRRLPEIINQTPLYNIGREAVIIRSASINDPDTVNLQTLLTTALHDANSQKATVVEAAHGKLPQHYLPVYVCTEE